MNYDTDNKTEVRAWLFELLARLERVRGVSAEKKELAPNKVVLEIVFKD